MTEKESEIAYQRRKESDERARDEYARGMRDGYAIGWRAAESKIVHNHGTEDGPGLACRESLVDGRLVGNCIRSIVLRSQEEI